MRGQTKPTQVETKTKSDFFSCRISDNISLQNLTFFLVGFQTTFHWGVGRAWYGANIWPPNVCGNDKSLMRHASALARQHIFANANARQKKAPGVEPGVNDG